MSYSETWVWNDVLDLSNMQGKSFNILYAFPDKPYGDVGEEYVSMKFYSDSILFFKIDDTFLYYDYNRWREAWCKTITFLEPPTGDLLAYLQQNATKQENPPEPEPTPTFEITTAKLTPRSVYTNEPFVISIGFQELVTWLIDRNDTFIIDADSNYILTGD